MEKGESKIAIVEAPLRSGGSGKSVGLLAAAVALLAVAFIVLIGCGTLVLKKQACDQEKSSADVTQRYDQVYETESHVKWSENVVLDPTERKEYIVTRNAETGHVETVVTIDFNTGMSTLYYAPLNTCFMTRSGDRDFDDVVRAKHQEQQFPGDGTAQSQRQEYRIGDAVNDARDIPNEMAPFCTTTNSRWLEELTEHERNKRQATQVCFICDMPVDAYYVDGVLFYLSYCIWWDLCPTCTCSDPVNQAKIGWALWNSQSFIEG